ncbi:MAG: universal stress protein [Desulfobulbaceae bacterium]|jgi:nucleotide-binding universal stress UspA family protein|nr:universal stress protein [Desulfobulbaceae bacterium]
MQDIRQIIVPVDFHQHTDDLVEFAIGIAKKLEAKVTFVHVVEKLDSYSDDPAMSFGKIAEELRGYAEKKMAALLEKSKGLCPGCAGQVFLGDVADSVVAYATDSKADMVIMGTHGARGIEKIMLGSVAERVLKRVHCPTLVFNPYRGERGYQISASVSESVLPI